MQIWVVALSTGPGEKVGAVLHPLTLWCTSEATQPITINGVRLATKVGLTMRSCLILSGLSLSTAKETTSITVEKALCQ